MSLSWTRLVNLKIICIKNCVNYDSFIEAQFKAEERAREASQSCLDETGSLISTLERTQRERLSKTPPPHLSNIMPPSDFELQLGTNIIIKFSTPPFTNFVTFSWKNYGRHRLRSQTVDSRYSGFCRRCTESYGSFSRSTSDGRYELGTSSHNEHGT